MQVYNNSIIIYFVSLHQSFKLDYIHCNDNFVFSQNLILLHQKQITDWFCAWMILLKPEFLPQN